DNKWGKRVSDAFKEEWLKLGGETVSDTSYNSKKNDFSTPIKTLLAIDKSTERRNTLSALLKTRLKFEPRRRQDIDFVFMAAFPKQARLIPPQLKFFHAANVPIYATSHSFSGRLDSKKDRDLDSVVIGDMPWTLSRAKNDNYKRQIYRTWPNKSRQFNRLYAFGTDAYNILYYLNWLRANTNSMLQGATGELHMSESNLVTRKLSWAKFKKGRPSLLPATATLNIQ
ncbi:MAG: penicillin-binding protein activator, partial [Gammaproteobacteria bacterium]|nr:penicillin-binding protein activator [Gammaproteobacteria bacterium]